jgi:hypothetical protein
MLNVTAADEGNDPRWPIAVAVQQVTGNKSGLPKSTS